MHPGFHAVGEGHAPERCAPLAVSRIRECVTPAVPAKGSLQGALRYDRVTSWAPEGLNGTDQTTRFNSLPIRFPRQDSVTGFNDFTPRVGIAYDLFGTGKTALKFSAGKYLSAATADGIYSSQNQGLNFVRTASRAWTSGNTSRAA